jgi:hypothetical protein
MTGPPVKIPDVHDEVERILAGTDLARVRSVCERHAATARGHGYSKYTDVAGQVQDKLLLVRRLGLHRGPPRRILDLGTGAGYFPLICRASGHAVVATDLDDNPLYNDMVAALGIERRVHRIVAGQSLPDLGGPFDVVTAFQVCFNGHKSPQLWGPAEWRAFLEDVARHQLAPGGRIILGLNAEEDGHCLTPQLLALFRELGAEVDVELVLIADASALRRRVLSGPFATNGGRAFTASLPADLPAGDAPEELFRSDLVLFEDGMPLGPAHERHNRIREHGGGAYCHWGTTLYFSASDGSDPNANGRVYSLDWCESSAAAAGRNEAAARIAAFVARGSPGAAATVRAATAFVHGHSEHRIDAEHDRYAFDTPRILQWMLAVAQGETTARPHLSCGPRAYALKAVLDELGLRSRLVQVFSTRGEDVGAHRLLEAWDEDAGCWTAWDADHDVTLVDVRTGRPAGVETWVLRGPDAVAPERDGVHGWDALGLAWLRDHDFAALQFESPDRRVGLRDPVILFDPRRFDPARRFEAGAVFSDWARGMFGECRFVAVRAAAPG